MSKNLNLLQYLKQFRYSSLSAHSTLWSCDRESMKSWKEIGWGDNQWCQGLPSTYYCLLDNITSITTTTYYPKRWLAQSNEKQNCIRMKVVEHDGAIREAIVLQCEGLNRNNPCDSKHWTDWSVLDKTLNPSGTVAEILLWGFHRVSQKLTMHNNCLM